MKWYFIVLICIGVFVCLFLLILGLGKLIRPKFKRYNKSRFSKVEQPMSTPIISSTVDSMIGLNLDNKLNLDEDIVFDTPNATSPSTRKLDSMGFEEFKNKLKAKQQKTLLEQIQELSPELKVLLFDRGLARKDYELMSKKD